MLNLVKTWGFLIGIMSPVWAMGESELVQPAAAQKVEASVPSLNRGESIRAFLNAIEIEDKKSSQECLARLQEQGLDMAAIKDLVVEKHFIWETVAKSLYGEAQRYLDIYAETEDPCLEDIRNVVVLALQEKFLFEQFYHTNRLKKYQHTSSKVSSLDALANKAGENDLFIVALPAIFGLSDGKVKFIDKDTP